MVFSVCLEVSPFVYLRVGFFPPDSRVLYIVEIRNSPPLFEFSVSQFYIWPAVDLLPFVFHATRTTAKPSVLDTTCGHGIVVLDFVYLRGSYHGHQTRYAWRRCSAVQLLDSRATCLFLHLLDFGRDLNCWSLWFPFSGNPDIYGGDPEVWEWVVLSRS